MSLCSLIISKQPIDDISKDRYHKHELIHADAKSEIYVYGRMGDNVLSQSQTVLMPYHQFLLKIHQISSPIFVIIDELAHQQSELDLAMQKIRLLNTQSKTTLPIDAPIDYGKIYFLN